MGARHLATAVVVEEASRDREDLKLALRKIGYNVITREGDIVLRLLEGKAADLFVIDLHYSDFDPFMLIPIARHKGIPCIAVAESFLQEEAFSACRLGASMVWALPLDVERFCESVTSLYELSQAQKCELSPARSVLIVDDNTDTRHAFRRTLEDAGLCVLEASDGPEGLLLASRHVVDLVLLDVNLPRMNGVSVCDILKSTQETRNIQVLICTVRQDQQTREAASSADGFLMKPVSPRTLLSKISTLIPLSITEPQKLRRP